MSFTIFQSEKTPFKAIKKTSPKSRKIDIFPNGLTHGFGPKEAIFPTFFLGKIGQENFFYDNFLTTQGRKISFTIFQTEKKPFQAIKTRSSKSQKKKIFPKGLTHGFEPKMAIILLFLVGNRGQKNVFYNILKWKKAFLGYKNKKFKKWKN